MPGAGGGWGWLGGVATRDSSRLPLDERLRLIQRAADEAEEDTPKPGPVGASLDAGVLPHAVEVLTVWRAHADDGAAALTHVDARDG
jgi:hypothetical protein